MIGCRKSPTNGIACSAETIGVTMNVPTTGMFCSHSSGGCTSSTVTPVGIGYPSGRLVVVTSPTLVGVSLVASRPAVTTDITSEASAGSAGSSSVSASACLAARRWNSVVVARTGVSGSSCSTSTAAGSASADGFSTTAVGFSSAAGSGAATGSGAAAGSSGSAFGAFSALSESALSALAAGLSNESLCRLRAGLVPASGVPSSVFSAAVLVGAVLAGAETVSVVVDDPEDTDVDDVSDEEPPSSATATPAPATIAAPIPSATANPPTRPTKDPAPMGSIDTGRVRCPWRVRPIAPDTAVDSGEDHRNQPPVDATGKSSEVRTWHGKVGPG